MAAEVLLEVEDAQGVALIDVEELAESGIGLDHLLLHQTLLSGVLADTSGDFRTRDERTLGETQEGGECVRDLSRDGEDGGLLLDGRRAICRSSASAATTLGSLLQLTRDLLLQLLHVGMDGVDGSASSVDGLHEAGELSSDVDVLLSGGNRCSSGRSRDGDRSRGDDDGSGDDGSRGGDAGGSGRSSGGGGLLGGLLRSSC